MITLTACGQELSCEVQETQWCVTVLALQLVENDPKALFRRCQAYEALGKVDEAYKDLLTLMKVDPKNTAAAAIYQKLNPIMQEKVRKSAN